MNYYLENEHLKAEIKSKGAELSSLQKKETQTEYIWQANPKFWNRQTPVLFPIVGKLKNNEYHFEGKTYEMGQHGFARDKEFTLVSQSKNELILELREDDETLQNFPFQFILQIHYLLKNNKLETKYLVKNPDNKTLYFSIGGHPAYNCPLENNEKREDYFLEFDADENAPKYLLTPEGISSESVSVFPKAGILPIEKTLFDDDALIFKSLKSEAIRLKNKAQKTVLEFRFKGFPFFGIWSQSQEAPFVCLEPWCGIADGVEHDGNLATKEGIECLEKDEIFERSYEVEIF